MSQNRYRQEPEQDPVHEFILIFGSLGGGTCLGGAVGILVGAWPAPPILGATLVAQLAFLLTRLVCGQVFGPSTPTGKRWWILITAFAVTNILSTIIGHALGAGPIWAVSAACAAGQLIFTGLLWIFASR